jgi:hypothetical protein
VRIVVERPDWDLRLYGGGEQRRVTSANLGGLAVGVVYGGKDVAKAGIRRAGKPAG